MVQSGLPLRLVQQWDEMKPEAPSAPRKSAEKPEMKSGLPGAPEEQRRDLRAAMKKHQETLRRLAQ